ncbi:hypothetical protein [Skermanella pratensis]|uniref:hypothetical protein n=1 Tax=Skermanella pratensis TaxID=2233999 RepID=UPI001301451D|nr:hypothetical protein [Skermanella pratensis]
MGKVIRIRISGTGVGTDAPGVEDLLDQVRDCFEILRGVEEAMAGDGMPGIDWRIVNAGRNSPLALECEAFSRTPGRTIDHRAELVMSHTALGLEKLQESGQRPEYFTDKVLVRARGIFERVNNGLCLTELDFGTGLPRIMITSETGQGAVANVRRVLEPVSRPYRETGSLEGFVHSVERDGYGRKILFVRHRITGETVKCILNGKAIAEVEERQIADVFQGRRVQVSGILHFKSLGRIVQLDAEDLKFFPHRSELPQVDDIIDRDFTDGMTSGEYLERLRNGRFS